MKKTVSFSKNASNIFFHILTSCNLSCRHCYINPSQHGTKPLSIDAIVSWLTWFADSAGQANVIFLGGEPTLHPELPGAIKAARKLGYSSVTVDTNGYLFNDILSKITPDELDFFSFSLDGATRETNDRIRGQGSFDNCISGIRHAIHSGFQSSVIYTVSKENFHEIEKMPPLLADLGIDRFFIQVIGIRGKSAQKETLDHGLGNRQLSPEEWLNTIPPVAEAAAQLGIVVSYPKVFLRKEEAFACAGIEAENYFIFPLVRASKRKTTSSFPMVGFIAALFAKTSHCIACCLKITDCCQCQESTRWIFSRYAFQRGV